MKPAPSLRVPAARADAPAPGLEITPRLAAAVYLALAVVYFLPAFLPGRQIFGTDYLAGSYPFYNFIVGSLSAGQLPRWVPYVFGGMPLAANPGSTFHPVVLIGSQFLAAERVFALMFLVHFWVACLGMYALARELGCRSAVAFVAGLAFGFTGLTASWVYAGHDGRVIAASMFPAVFFFLRRGVRTNGVANFAGAAASIGLALLSFQLQVTYYLLLGAGVWGVYCVAKYAGGRSWPANARTVALGIGTVAAAFCLAAVAILPFQDYVPNSPRGQAGGRGYEYAVSYSMPPSGFLAMAVPEQPGASISDPETGKALLPAYSRPGGFKLHTEYVGAWVILMLVAGVAVSRRNRDWQFFAAFSVAGATLALGGNTPLYRLYYALLPGLDKFRAPDLAFCLVSFAACVMAALALEQLAADAEPPQGGARLRRTETADPGARTTLVAVAGVVGVAVLGALLSGAAGTGETPSRAAGWVRFAFFAAVAGGVVVQWRRRALAPRVAVLALSLAVTVDLWVIDRKFFHTYAPPSEVFGADDVVTFLKTRPGPFRVWALTIPQTYRGGGSYGSNYLMVHGIDQVAGEHPNPLQRWDEYLGEGTQTYIDWRRVLRTPAVVEGPDGQALTFESTPGFLDAANVRYIISMAPLSIPGLREVYRGTALVYENPRALGRAFLVPSAVAAAPDRVPGEMDSGRWDPRTVAFVEPGAVSLPPGPLQGSADIVEYTPDRAVVAVRASRAALLVLADNYYPGWRATIDGADAPVIRANHTFRAVAVPAGVHRVTFTYAPDDLRTGMVVSLVTLAVLAAAATASVFTARRRSRAARAGHESPDAPSSLP